MDRLGMLPRVSRHAPLALFLCAIWGACDGCKGCDPDGMDDDALHGTEFVSPGEGTPNEEPLWLLHPGQRIGEEVSVLEPVELEGEQVVPLASTRRGPTVHLGWPNEPAAWLYFSQDSDGNIWFRGQPREGLTPTPALFVPATVRVGMKWSSGRVERYEESFQDGTGVANDFVSEPCANPDPRAWEGHECDGGRFTIEVTARRAEDTPYGIRPVWSFRVTDWRAMRPLAERPYPDDDVFDGVSFEIEFIEGRGPRQWPGAASFEGAGLSTTGLTPLEPWVAPEPLPAIELEPLRAGQPLGGLARRTLARGASGYLDPNGFGDEALTAFSGRWMFYSQGGTEDLRQPFWTAVPIDHCVTHGADGGESAVFPWAVDAAEAQDCLQGGAVAVPSDGGPRSQIPATPGYSIGALWVPRGMYEGPGGTIYGVFPGSYGHYSCANLNAAGECLIRNATGWPNELTYEVGEVGVDGAAVDYTTHRGFARWARSTLEEDPVDDALWLDANGATVRVIEPTKTLRFAAWDSAAGQTRFEHVAYHGLGDFNVFSKPGGRDVLLSTFAGRLERVHMLDDGIEIEPLGDVVVPRGQFLAGAVIVDDELVVYTQKHYSGFDSWLDRGWYGCPGCKGLDPAHVPDLGEVFVWRADLPERAKSRPSPIWGTTATISGHDVLVCWPPGHGEPELEGWTLGGYEPRQVSVVGGEERCVLLSRDLAIADNLARNSAWTVEGPIPGYGRVALATHVKQTRQLVRTPCLGLGPACKLQHAQHVEELGDQYRSSGASAGERIHRDGTRTAWGGTYPTMGSDFLETIAQGGLHSLRYDAVVTVDATGNGFFAHVETKLFHWDGTQAREIADIRTPAEVTANPLCQGGGVIVGETHYAADGTATPIPAGAGELTGPFRLVDGSMCGLRSIPSGTGSQTVVSCVDPAGVFRDGPPASQLGSHIFGKDGRIYASMFGQRLGDRPSFVRFDPSTMELDRLPLTDFGLAATQDDELSLGDPSVAPGGETFALLTARRITYSDHVILRFDASGPTVIERPELRHVAYTNPRLSVDANFFVLTSNEPYLPTHTDADSAWFARPPLLRIPREGDRSRPQADFPTGEPDCIPVRSINSGQLTETELSVLESWALGDSIGPLLEVEPYTGSANPTQEQRDTRSTYCTNAAFEVLTDGGPPPQVEVLDERGEKVETTSGGKFYWVQNLAPFGKYTIRAGGGDYEMFELDFVTSRSGQSLWLGRLNISEVAPGRMLADATVLNQNSCGVTRPTDDGSGCGFAARLDPNNKKLLLEVGEDAQLVWADPAAPAGVATLALSTGGVFSPDGQLVVGERGAWDVVFGQSVELDPEFDGASEPTFALAEHPRVFLPRRDGSGVVLEWSRTDGSITEVVRTIGSVEATFAGDGRSVITLENGVGAGQFEVVRYSFADGTRTVLWSGAGPIANLKSNGAGNVVYTDTGRDPPTMPGVNGTRRVYVIREGRNARVFAANLYEQMGFPPALVVDRRGKGGFWFAEEADGSFQAYRYDEDAAAPPMGELANVFLPIPGLRFGKFDGTRVVAVGDGAMAMSFDTNATPTTRLLAPFDGTELMDFPGLFSGVVRSDGKVAMASEDRRLVVLSADQSVVEDDIDDSANPDRPWPYGANRDRHEGLADVTASVFAAEYWRHFDPTGLDMPCLLYMTERIDYRNFYGMGIGDAILDVQPVLMCY